MAKKTSSPSSSHTDSLTLASLQAELRRSEERFAALEASIQDAVVGAQRALDAAMTVGTYLSGVLASSASFLADRTLSMRILDREKCFVSLLRQLIELIENKSRGAASSQVVTSAKNVIDLIEADTELHRAEARDVFVSLGLKNFKEFWAKATATDEREFLDPAGGKVPEHMRHLPSFSLEQADPAKTTSRDMFTAFIPRQIYHYSDPYGEVGVPMVFEIEDGATWVIRCDRSPKTVEELGKNDADRLKASLTEFVHVTCTDEAFREICQSTAAVAPALAAKTFSVSGPEHALKALSALNRIVSQHTR